MTGPDDHPDARGAETVKALRAGMSGRVPDGRRLEDVRIEFREGDDV